MISFLMWTEKRVLWVSAEMMEGLQGEWKRRELKSTRKRQELYVVSFSVSVHDKSVF